MKRKGQINRFNRTLRSFKVERAEENQEPGASVTDIFRGFASAQVQSLMLEERDVQRQSRLLENWGDLRHLQRENIEGSIENLNIFEVLGFARDETRHSRVLAWLLDPRGSHGQQSLFFRAFLNTVLLPQRWSNYEYHVETERTGDESRIDIRVYSAGSFVIDIEVKVDSEEGKEQLVRETRDAQRFANSLGVLPEGLCCLFLTRDGHLPVHHGIFRSITWRAIGRSLEQNSADSSLPARLWTFLEDYKRLLNRITMG